jgi:fibronectin type 3 domain-containing protein
MLTTGCEAPKSLQTPTAEPKIDEKLPVLDVQTIKTMPDIKSVSIEWIGTDVENIAGYYIYRKDLEKEDSKYTRVGTVKDKYTKHYVDSDLTPNTQYAYCISVIGENGFESNPSDARAVRTYPVFDSVSFIHATSNLPRKIRIEWRPHDLLSIKEYLLEKSTPAEPEWKKVAPIKNRLNAEFIDGNLKDAQTYSYRLKAISFDGIESNPSEIVTATTKPLPIAPFEPSATQDQPRKIILTWKVSPQTDKVAYNIYASDDATDGYKKIFTAGKDDNTFEHKIDKNDKTVFYKVTTLDKDALESDIKLLAPTIGKTLSAPLQPTVTLAQITPNGVILNWTKGDDRAVSYNVYKTIKESFFQSSEKMFKNVQALRFEDTDVIRGIEYAYEIEAVDQFGLVSNKTKKAALSMPKLEEKPEPKPEQSQQAN